MPTELDTPENRLHPTDVTFLRRRIVGAYLPWPPYCKYANKGETLIHERSCARRIIYAVYVSRTPDVKLFPIYEAQLMQRYGPGNSRRILRCLRSST